MGRVKLKLKTVESRTGRIVTYSKRKNALLKKANELAVLCGIDVVLLMFSPTGKVALQMGNAAKFDQIIRRFASTSAEERVRSKMEVFETLKKSYKNSDHEVQAKYFSGSRPRSVEDLIARSNLLQEQLTETQQRLSDWRNPDKIEDVELLGNMEDYLGVLFDEINSQKMKFSKKEIVELESSYENQIYLTSSAGVEIQSLGSNCNNIAHTPDQNFHVNREPLMGTSSTAANISRLENAVIDNSRDYTNNLLHSKLLRNEVAAFRSEAWRNEFARSEFLINAYKEAGYSTYDITKWGISGNRFFEAEIKNNEFFMADNSSVQLQQQNPCPQQSIIPLNQQNIDQLQQQNIYMVKQQNIVPIQQQVPCPLQNMDNSFNVNLEAPLSSYDPFLEWSSSFDALDFSLLDSQQPLSIDDYEHADQLKFQIELP